MRHPESSSPCSLPEPPSLGALLEEHGPRLLAMIKRRLAPALAARLSPEDVLNDALLLAQRRWRHFRIEATLSPYAWLYRIVLDRVLEAWRQQTRARRDARRDLPWPEASSLQLGLGLVNAETSPSGAAAREELRRRMRRTLDLLKKRDREILWMRHYDQLTFPEAAQVLGIGESAATLRYVRALRRLRNLWQQLYPSEGPPR